MLESGPGPAGTAPQLPGRSPPDRRGGALDLLIVGTLGLALGVLVYLTDRPPGHASALPAIAWLSERHLFGALGLWLPSFVHPFGFSLLTAAALQRRAKPRYDACIAWGAINVAFELGQHPQIKAALATALREALAGTPLARPLSNYFLRGTFDPGDLVAIVLGSLAAALVLRLRQTTPETAHAP